MPPQVALEVLPACLEMVQQAVVAPLAEAEAEAEVQMAVRLGQRPRAARVALVATTDWALAVALLEMPAPMAAAEVVGVAERLLLQVALVALVPSGIPRTVLAVAVEVEVEQQQLGLLRVMQVLGRFMVVAEVVVRVPQQVLIQRRAQMGRKVSSSSHTVAYSSEAV